MRSLLLSLSLGFALTAGAAAPAQEAPAKYQPGALPVEQTAGWVVLDNGRHKPLDSYARELIVQLSGRKTTELDGTTALELVWGYSLSPEDFLDRPYVKVDNDDLKLLIGVPKGERRFSFNTLAVSAELNRLANEGFRKSEAEEEVTPVEKDAMRVWNKLGRIGQLRAGAGLTIVPILGTGGEWASPATLVSAPEGSPGSQVLAPYERLRQAFRAGDSAGFTAAATELGGLLSTMAPDVYPDTSKIELELTYNSLDSFGWASKLFLLGFFLILGFRLAEKRLGYAIGLGCVVAGLVLQTVGIGMRWAIAGRAPVSDMYESLVFMGWGVIAIGLVLELVYRRGYFGMAAGLLGYLALAFASYLPATVMNSAISPLPPVLLNTYWLSVHVITIMLSYSAFALAMGIGHIVMALQLFQPGRTNRLRVLSNLLNKTIQVGVLFLGAGIAFGAIWANESWGRYWGWDAKETWSAITFFVYLAVIHARYAGWIQHFGLAASSIAAFAAVVFTYFGVNYVLDAGLHSYGRGSGGAVWVFTIVGLDVILVLVAWWRYQVGISTGRIAKPAMD